MTTERPHSGLKVKENLKFRIDPTLPPTAIMFNPETEEEYYSFKFEKPFWREQEEHEKLGNILTEKGVYVDQRTAFAQVKDFWLRLGTRWGRENELIAAQDKNTKPQNSPNKQQPEQVFNYSTNHLAEYDALLKLTRLYGENYTIYIKALWYQTHSMIAREKLFEIGDLIEDCRLHLNFVLEAGCGKQELINTRRRISKKLNLRYCAPTTWHPEQFIGKLKLQKKTKKDPNPKPIEARGFFDEEEIDLDEAHRLLSSSKDLVIETRENLRKATNRFGSNTVEKKQVDYLPDMWIRYDPICNISIFLQPRGIEEDIVADGTLRRFLTLYKDVNTGICEEDFTSRLKGRGENECYLDAYCTHLQKARKVVLENELEFKQEAVEMLRTLHLELLKQGVSWSTKGRHYTMIMKWSLQNLLAELAVLQAISRYKPIVEEIDVKLAYLDLCEFFASTLDYVETFVEGSLESGKDWGGAVGKDQDCLRWLYEQGARSFDESKTSIDEYRKAVGEIFNVGDDMAEKHYRRHVTSGWVDSKQLFQNNTRVWLLSGPTEMSFFSQPSKPNMGTYRAIHKEIQEKIGKHPLKPLQALQASKDQECKDSKACNKEPELIAGVEE